MRMAAIYPACTIAIALVVGCLVDNPAWDGPAGGDAGGSVGDDGGVVTPRCEPLPAPAGPRVDVTPAQAAMLDEIVAAAAPGTSVVLADGTYDRTGEPPIAIAAAGLALRSASGEPDAVVIDGGTTGDALVVIAAADVVIAELSLRRPGNRIVRIVPGASSPRLYRIHAADAPGFHVAIEADVDAARWVDDGEVACSEFRLSDAGRAAIDDCTAMGVIKGFGAARWAIRDNLFAELWCPADLPFAAIHFGFGATDTLIERNLFRDVYRGVLIGSDGTAPGAPIAMRPLPSDRDCVTQAVHAGAVVRNNVFWTGGTGIATAPGPDAMLAIWAACAVDVQHNTLIDLLDAFSGIEYRWDQCSGSILNNLSNREVLARDGAPPVVVAGNIDDVGLEAFVDPGAGDLHLRPGASAAIDGSVVVGPPPPTDDVDGQTRDASPDVGADELDP